MPAATPPSPLAAILGRSRAIADVRQAIERVAATPRTTVLIGGPSGAGKELVARAIHLCSSRRQGPFVAVNCAALNDALLEAELFGYEPGAFTGARPKGAPGLIAAAEGGTLLLDEVGELAPALQAKLLRVLQERTYRRVGGDADRAFDVRILAATNRDLGELVALGTFRDDLYYRLNVMSIRVPALCERPEDVAPLAEHFLAHFAREFGREYRPFDARTLERLEAHAWPGNVRELRNAIERAALLAPGDELAVEHLLQGAAALRAAPQAAPRAVEGPGDDVLPLGDRSLRAVEKALIERVLAESRGNRSRAARVLGVDRSTLYSKLRAYGVARA